MNQRCLFNRVIYFMHSKMAANGIVDSSNNMDPCNTENKHKNPSIRRSISLDTENQKKNGVHHNGLLTPLSIRHANSKPRHKLLTQTSNCDDVMYLSSESLCSLTVTSHIGKAQSHSSGKDIKQQEVEDLELELPSRRNPNIDRGYAWVIVFGAGLTFFLGGGFGKAYTMMYQQLLNKFDSSAKAAALVGSVYGGVKMCSSPIVSALLNKFGFRAVVITGGLLSGCGFMWTAFPTSLVTVYLSYSIIEALSSNMVYASSMIVIGKYFDKRKGKAMALALMCMSLGGASIAPLMEFLYRYYGYSGAILIYSGLALHYCVSGALYRQPPKYDDIDGVVTNSAQDDKHDIPKDSETDRLNSSDKPNDTDVKSASGVQDKNKEARIAHETEDTSIMKSNDQNKDQMLKCRACSRIITIMNKYFGLQLLQNKKFVFYCIFMAVIFAAFGSENSFIGPLAKQNADMDAKTLAIFISISSVFEFIARLVAGYLFDLKSNKPYKRIEFAFIGMMTGTLMVVTGIFAKTVPTFCVSAISFQICASMLHTQHIPILSDIVGREDLASATGIMRFFIGIGILCGPVSGGALKDYTGSYSYAYLLPGLTLGVLSMIFMGIMIYHLKRDRKRASSGT